MGRLYRCLRAVVRAVTPRMTTTWEEPFSGNPSIFVCNHVGAFGPIDMVVKFRCGTKCACGATRAS